MSVTSYESYWKTSLMRFIESFMNPRFPTIRAATAAFDVQGLDPSLLTKQQEAYELCLEFLDGIESIRTFNRSHTSYRLKHVVENPAGRMGIPSDPDCYSLYVYEGTFILAALAASFQMKQTENGLTAIFNISERSLKRRTKEVAASRLAAKAS
jgi:hypothetical protein